MDNRERESQRAELHKTIWRIANDFRGSVDGWDFKQYVLGMLFYRFISENLAACLNDLEHKAGDTTFDYTKLDDTQAEFGGEETTIEKGLYILPAVSSFTAGSGHAAKKKTVIEKLNAYFSRFFGIGWKRTGGVGVDGFCIY